MLDKHSNECHNIIMNSFECKKSEKTMFEKLWDEYFYEKCLTVVTDEERAIFKKVAEFTLSLLNETKYGGL